MQRINEEELEEWAQQVIQWAQEKVEKGEFNVVIGRLDDIITALTILTKPEYRKQLLKFYRTITTQLIKVMTNANRLQSR